MGKKEEAAEKMAAAAEEHGTDSDEAWEALKDFAAAKDDDE